MTLHLPATAKIKVINTLEPPHSTPQSLSQNKIHKRLRTELVQDVLVGARKTGKVSVDPIFHVILSSSKSKYWRKNLDSCLGVPHQGMSMRISSLYNSVMKTRLKGATPLLVALAILDIGIVQYLVQKYMDQPSSWAVKDLNGYGILFYVYWAILRLKCAEGTAESRCWERLYLEFNLLSIEWKLRHPLSRDNSNSNSKSNSNSNSNSSNSGRSGGRIPLHDPGFLKGVFRHVGAPGVRDALIWLKSHGRYKTYEKDLLNLVAANPVLIPTLIPAPVDAVNDLPEILWNRRLSKGGCTIMTYALDQWNFSPDSNAGKRNQKFLLQLLDHIDPHVSDGKGRIPLDIAIAKRYYWFIKALMKMDQPYLSEIGSYLPGICKKDLDYLFETRNTSLVLRCLREIRTGPRLIEPIDLARLLVEHYNEHDIRCTPPKSYVEGFTVTQKADGLYRANTPALLESLPTSIRNIPRLLVEAEECQISINNHSTKHYDWCTNHSIPKTTIFYIFNIQGDHEALSNKSYPERMTWLRMQWSESKRSSSVPRSSVPRSSVPRSSVLRSSVLIDQKVNILTCKKDFLKITAAEHKVIADYIGSNANANATNATSPDGPVLSWPKAVYKFSDFRVVWEISKILNPSQRPKAIRVLPDDGVILRPDFRSSVRNQSDQKSVIKINGIWKFKPQRELTIDLVCHRNEGAHAQVLGGGSDEAATLSMRDRDGTLYAVVPRSDLKGIIQGKLYRCRWLPNNRVRSVEPVFHWTVHKKDIRVDKILPNTEEMVTKIVWQLKHPWTYQEVLSLVAPKQRMSARAFYGPKQGVIKQVRLRPAGTQSIAPSGTGHTYFFKAIREWSESTLHRLLDGSTDLRILDLGSGSHTPRFLEGINYRSYTGLDIDPFILNITIGTPGTTPGTPGTPRAHVTKGKQSYFWADMCSNLREYDCLQKNMPSLWSHFYPGLSALPEITAEFILNIHSLHYIIPRGRGGWIQYMRNIDEISRYACTYHYNAHNPIEGSRYHDGSGYWLILFNDGDVIPNGRYEIGETWMDITTEGNTSGQDISPIASDKICTYHYPWIHTGASSSFDFLISGKALIRELSYWDWHPVNTLNISEDNDLFTNSPKQMSAWIKSYTMIILSKTLPEPN